MKGTIVFCFLVGTLPFTLLGILGRVIKEMLWFGWEVGDEFVYWTRRG